MNWLQQQLGQLSKPDLIVHIGAGECSDLADYQRFQPSKVVLVEPNPETVVEIRSRASEWDNVTILHAAISDQTGNTSLRLFNFPELDGLYDPVGLYSLLPGLRQIDQIAVPALSAEKLIGQLSFKANGNHWLVLEASGQEGEILKALQACDGLIRFNHLILRAAAESFYDPPHPCASDLLRSLESQGYILVGQPDDGDADWPRYHLRLDRMALECKRLRSELADHKKWEQEYKADMKAIESALQQVQQVLVEAEKARAEDEERHQSELESARKLLVERSEALESALAEEKASCEKLGTKLEARNKEVSRLTEAKDAAQQQLAKAKEHHQAELAEAHDAAQQQLSTAKERHQSELAEAQKAHTSDLAAAQQKLTKAEAESKSLRQQNDELQKKYRQLEQEYQRKEALIDEEFLKAESQLELIKELVFKDKPI